MRRAAELLHRARPHTGARGLQRGSPHPLDGGPSRASVPLAGIAGGGMLCRTVMAGENDPGAALNVAAVQMSSQDDVAANLQAVDTLTTRAAKAGAELVLLPENFAFFGTEGQRARHAEALNASDGPIQSALRRIAKREHVTLIGGGFPERSEEAERPYNTSVVFGADGELAGAYRKIHLFDVDLRNH